MLSWRAFRKSMEGLRRADPRLANFYARTAEHAIRLATIVAMGESPCKPAVSLANVEWGKGVATWCAQTMIKAIGLYVSSSDAQRDAQHVFRALLDTRKKQMPKRELCRALKNHFKPRELAELLTSLVDSGAITMADVRDTKTKRTTCWIFMGEKK